MKLIDAHCHICEYINGWGSRGELRALGDGKACYADGKEFQLFPRELGDTGVTPEAILSIFDKYNVEKGVLLQGNYLGFQNLYVAEAIRKYPERFTGACTIDPFCKNRDLIAKNLFENLNFKILKMEVSNTSGLMANHNTISLKGKEMKYIYDLARKYKLTLVIDIGRPGNPCHQVKNLSKMIKKYSDVTFVICHLGSHQLNQQKLFYKNIKALAKPNVYFDIASVPSNTKEPYPFNCALEYVKMALEIAGEDKIMWGSDCPTSLTKCSYEENINYLINSNIDRKVLEKIFYTNALNVYFKI